jgi:hypothetical protein
MSGQDRGYSVAGLSLGQYYTEVIRLRRAQSFDSVLSGIGSVYCMHRTR